LLSSGSETVITSTVFQNPKDQVINNNNVPLDFMGVKSDFLEQRITCLKEVAEEHSWSLEGISYQFRLLHKEKSELACS
jgi:hypothetical protein